MNIKAIIAEDEQKNRENLRQLLLKHCPGIDIIDCCSSAAEAYEIIVSLQPELVFLDIEMPGMDGVSMARAIRRENEAVQIVFITGYSDYIVISLRATMWPRACITTRSACANA